MYLSACFFLVSLCQLIYPFPLVLFSLPSTLIFFFLSSKVLAVLEGGQHLLHQY